MTVAEMREELFEAMRYVRSNRVASERIAREVGYQLGMRAAAETDQSPFWVRLAANVHYGADMLVVDPDAGKGYFAGVRHEIALAIGRGA